MAATTSGRCVVSQRFLRAFRIFKHSLTGIGLSAVFLAVVLLCSASFRSDAASAFSRWAAFDNYSQDSEFVLAPFELESAVADQNIIPDGSSKHPVRILANLPVLNVSELSEQQIKVTQWLANRYRVAPEMVALLVQESWNIGERTNIDPTLLLAIVAIESRFNPYAQSAVGATGLMQVMTNVHADKFERTGGTLTTYDPVTNLRVGVLVLQEHIKRAGSLEGGLKQYVGATGPSDYGYTAKVLAERDRIRRVMFGSSTPDIERILLAAQNIDTTISSGMQHASAVQATPSLTQSAL